MEETTVESLVLDEINDINETLENLAVGSKEYEALANRRDRLLDKAIEIGKFNAEANLKQQQIDAEKERFDIECERKQQQMEDEKKDRFVKNVLEEFKVGGAIVFPVIGLVWITAAEKDISFTGALREYTKYFLPRKI